MDPARDAHRWREVDEAWERGDYEGGREGNGEKRVDGKVEVKED